MIISAFPCTGKTMFCRNAMSLQVVDLDPTHFQWSSPGEVNPKFPENYIKRIKELDVAGKIVFVSSHDVIREALKAHELNYLLIRPDRRLLTEYLNRAVKRGSTQSFIDNIDNNWNYYLDSMEKDNVALQIVLGESETVSSCMQKFIKILSFW